MATARKLVVIAWQMLKNNEPYRYAQPAATEAKLSRLRVRATGARRKTGPAKGSAPAANQGTGQRSRTARSLPEVYAAEGLPAATAPERLPAGEERALVILLAGALGSEAETGASGWRGGRFAVWQPRSSRRQCTGPGCVTGDVGVVAFRWRHRDDASQFRLAVPAYTTLGLFAQVLSRRAWKLSDGYVALGTAPRGSALAFAPHRHLADWLATRSARSASAYDVQSERRGPTRARQG